MVEAGETYDELRGVELVGTGEIVEDPDRIWEPRRQRLRALQRRRTPKR